MLRNLYIYFVGRFAGENHTSLKRLAESHGAHVNRSCTRRTTHVVLPNGPDACFRYGHHKEVGKALDKPIPVVHLQWLRDSISAKKLKDPSAAAYKCVIERLPPSPPDVPALPFTFASLSKSFKRIYKSYPDAKGSPYYFNVLTNTTSWDPPPVFALKQLATEAHCTAQIAIVASYQKLLKQYVSKYDQIIAAESAKLAAADRGEPPPVLPVVPAGEHPAERRAGGASEQVAMDTSPVGDAAVAGPVAQQGVPQQQRQQQQPQQQQPQQQQQQFVSGDGLMRPILIDSRSVTESPVTPSTELGMAMGGVDPDAMDVSLELRPEVVLGRGSLSPIENAVPGGADLSPAPAFGLVGSRLSPFPNAAAGGDFGQDSMDTSSGV